MLSESVKITWGLGINLQNFNKGCRKTSEDHGLVARWNQVYHGESLFKVHVISRVFHD